MRGLRRNDIAIIGLSCRLPGAATADAYWKNLSEGIESITFFSDQELVAANVDPSLLADPRYVKAAPTLADVEMFDAAFFGYSPKDAALMDPQHRLFLEVCWETLENAGYDPAAYPGKVGVLATAGGVVTSYLLANLHQAGLPGQTASTAHINNDKDFLSTRVSYKLNLTGPSFTIQSACSSSLLAVHQACQMLRINECDMMLVGGSVVRVPQAAGYLAEKRNVHSADGHCRPFDSTGQGTIFGSGVGTVLLKPLRRAIADRDHIYAVIKGTAANNDGSAKNSYTAPSLGQQSQAVVDALKAARINPDTVGYVECHATGTTVGDPLEIEALTMAFRKQTSRKHYCAIGSVKANIGHPEQAAGIAGLIKTALVLHHKRIPPSINFQNPNPAIDFASSPFYVNTTLQDFPSGGTPRRAAVNSLGIGGTNAFAILEEPPPIAATEESPDHFSCVATLSAKSAEALVARARQLLNWLNDNSGARIGDICYTTNVSRSQFAFRLAAPACSVEELKKHIATWLGKVAENPSSVQRAGNAPIAFLFSGQGSQHAGMAAQLYRAHSVFRAALDRCDALAKPHLEHGLLDIIFAKDEAAALIDRTDYTQAALFAVEYALSELLKAWGIAPSAVIGHSVGEFSAARVADVMTLEDTLQLVIARGALMHRMPGGGGMMAIFAEEGTARRLIDSFAPALAVAAINGPLNTVVSGDVDALKVLAQELDRQGVRYRELHVANAFHSPRTESILDDLEHAAGRIKYNAPALPLVSNLTGGLLKGAPDKFYWRQHVRETVRFGEGMLALAELGCRTFLEVGPHPVLLPIAQACLATKDRSAAWIGTLNRKKSDAESMTKMLAGLYLAGQNINWTAVHADASWRRIPLPTYPFERKRYWLDGDPPQTRPAPEQERFHPLVGARINSLAKEACYETRFGVRHASYFSDHRVGGAIVLPTTALLEAATVVGRMHFGTSRVSFENAMHHQPMSFANGEDRTVRLLVTPSKSDKAVFKLVSAEAEAPKGWHTHMTGTLRKSEASVQSVSKVQIRARCERSLSAADFYERAERLGLQYGPNFRGIQEVHVGQHETLTKVHLPGDLASGRYLIHPAFLDACLHAYPLVLEDTEKQNGDCDHSYLPVSLEEFRCYQDGAESAWVHTKRRGVEKDGTQVIDIRVFDDAERLVADLQGLSVRLLPLATMKAARTESHDLFYRVAWRTKARDHAEHESNRAAASWLIFADAKGIGLALARRLEAAGHHCHLVYRGAEFVHRGAREWTLNERKQDDFVQLLKQVDAGELRPCAGVVYLWGLDAPPVEGLTLAALKSASEMMCRGALALLHALAQARSPKQSGRQLWLVTQNTQKLQSQSRFPDPVQAPLWGLGRTAAIEYPAIWGGLIDLERNGDTVDIEALAAEFLRPDGEAQIAIGSNNERLVPRLVAQSVENLPAKAVGISAQATYLVTGGLGMLGQSVTQWLIRKGAKHIVLIGRNASTEAAYQLNTLAERNGAAIRIVPVDIGREEDVSRLIQTISREMPPLRGVVHSAGVLDDGILAQLDWDRFSPVFEPKVYGSWLLHEYTKSLDLDFFILQSSVLSLLGSAGQANYCAGNAFLDSLATYRRAAGLPATTINWSAWSGGGLATASGARGEAMWSSLGVKFVAPDVAMDAFDKVMDRDLDHVAIVLADWPAYAKKVGHPFFLLEVTTTADEAGPEFSQRNGLRPPNPASLGNGTRQDLLLRLQQRITSELGFVNLIDPNLPLNEVGLDSLRSVTLANDLEDEFGVLISISELISGPTINALADHVSALIAGASTAESPSGPRLASATSENYQERPRDASLNGAGPHQFSVGQPEKTAIHIAENGDGRRNYRGPGINGKAPNSNGTSMPGKWLIAPRPNPDARVRLFCFPYAGGGLVSFRSWAQGFDPAVEVVAVEAPGRGTRITEPAVGDLDAFVQGLLPEMTAWLDRPSAFFGHCLGGLTMFAVLSALPKESLRFIKHAFACGVRPPHLLKRKGKFEDNLIYDMMLHREFDTTVPPYAQTDDVFADIIRRFDIPAANKMLEIPTLRKALLPTIRAEFGMAYNYDFQPVPPFSFPISSFVGEADPWVSEQDSASWADLTRGGFANHVRKGSHFLMADDGEYILQTIQNEFIASAAY